ncbi:MAG: hypothetical protein KF797_09435 [Flavobacteriales bacterium]|nr:hypothetical protein [Flavobacteriales bacterium]
MQRSWLLAPTLLFACASPQEPAAITGGDGTSTGTKVDIESLFGDWLDIQDSGRTYVHEHWERGADGTPTGIGHVLSGKDTVFIEHLALLTIRDTLHYAVSIGSKGGEATLFKLVHDRDSLVFTNPAHDMPQRIVYVPQGPDAWHAIVSGTHKGRMAVDHYHFDRVAGNDAASH